MHLIDSNAELVSGVGELAIRRVQEIPDDFLESLKCERSAKAHMRAGEMNRVASVPTQVIDVWLRQGFDFWNAKPSEIVARLNAHDLGVFITTPKRV